MGLARQLELLGHQVVAQASDGRQAVDMAGKQAVDLAVLDIRMPELDGIDAAKAINGIRPTPVIMVTAYCQDDLIERAADAGVYAYLAKPVRPDELRSAIAVALKRFAERSEMADEIGRLKLTLQERKIIERAKGVIMRRLGLTEEGAYQRLRRESQNTRKSMAKIAQAVIEAESLLAQKESGGPDEQSAQTDAVAQAAPDAASATARAITEVGERGEAPPLSAPQADPPDVQPQEGQPPDEDTAATDEPKPPEA
jgi:response regulator NasT